MQGARKSSMSDEKGEKTLGRTLGEESLMMLEESKIMERSRVKVLRKKHEKDMWSKVGGGIF